MIALNTFIKGNKFLAKIVSLFSYPALSYIVIVNNKSGRWIPPVIALCDTTAPAIDAGNSTVALCNALGGCHMIWSIISMHMFIQIVSRRINGTCDPWDTAFRE